MSEDKVIRIAPASMKALADALIFEQAVRARLAEVRKADDLPDDAKDLLELTAVVVQLAKLQEDF